MVAWTRATVAQVLPSEAAVRDKLTDAGDRIDRLIPTIPTISPFSPPKGVAGATPAPAGSVTGAPAMPPTNATAPAPATDFEAMLAARRARIEQLKVDGPRMLLTHYCAAGNQPTMLLVPGDDPAKPRFEFLRATNLEDPKAGHMHRAAFDLSQEGAITARWTFFHDGKAGDCAVIGVKRAE